MNAVLKRWPTAAVAVTVGLTVGWWVLPALVLLAGVAVATERVIAHFEQAELIDTVDKLEAATGVGLADDFHRAIGSLGRLRSTGAELPPASQPRHEHWVPRENANGIRTWVVEQDRLPLRTRIRARIAAVMRPYWTDLLLWLAMHEPTFWTESDLPERPDSLHHQARHRAPEEDEPPAEETEPVNEPDWRVSTGEIELGITAILEAGIYAGVARGAR